MMDEALALLDKWLTEMSERTMFTQDEVQDLVLDVRSAISRMYEMPEQFDAATPVLPVPA